MMRLQWLLLIAALTVIGCAPTERLSWSGKLGGLELADRGKVKEPSALQLKDRPDLIRVSAQAVRLRRGSAGQFPSFYVEDSTAEFRITDGAIPSKLGVERIRFDYAAPRNQPDPIVVGQSYTFRFTPDGRFFDIEGLDLWY